MVRIAVVLIAGFFALMASPQSTAQAQGGAALVITETAPDGTLHFDTAVPLAEATPQAKKPATDQQTDKVTVYVTRTGEKYHRAGCRYLARSQIPMALKDAAARYGPCSVCKPPTLAQAGPPSSTPPTLSSPPKSNAPSAQAVQCQAITKKGTQCSRRAQAGSIYCWQHGR